MAPAIVAGGLPRRAAPTSAGTAGSRLRGRRGGDRTAASAPPRRQGKHPTIRVSRREAGRPPAEPGAVGRVIGTALPGACPLPPRKAVLLIHHRTLPLLGTDDVCRASFHVLVVTRRWGETHRSVAAQLPFAREQPDREESAQKAPFSSPRGRSSSLNRVPRERAVAGS